MYHYLDSTGRFNDFCYVQMKFEYLPLAGLVTGRVMYVRTGLLDKLYYIFRSFFCKQFENAFQGVG